MAIEHPNHAAYAHEKTDADVRFLAGFSITVFILILAAMLLMWGLFKVLTGQRARSDVPASPLAAELPRLPPEPRLQTSPIEDLVTYRAQQNAVLESYGWVDKNLGIVRIPISRAMDLILERGLPARKEMRNAK